MGRGEGYVFKIMMYYIVLFVFSIIIVWWGSSFFDYLSNVMYGYGIVWYINWSGYKI